MTYSPIKASVLEMNEPFIAIYCINKSTLMRSIDNSISGMHYFFYLIRSIDILASKSDLISICYATCRSPDMIISIPLINLRSFNSDSRVIRIISVKNKVIFSKCPCSIGAHFEYSKNTLKTNPALSIAMYNVSFTVFIPKWTTINKAFSFQKTYRFIPLSKGIPSFYNIVSLVRHSIENVKYSFMVSYRRSPYSL